MSKMNFKIYRKDLKVTGEELVMFKFEVKSFKVEKVIVMIACLQNSKFFSRTTQTIQNFVYSIFLENFNISIQSI